MKKHLLAIAIGTMLIVPTSYAMVWYAFMFGTEDVNVGCHL